MGEVHRDLDRGLPGGRRADLGALRPERAQQPRPVGGLRPVPAGGGELHQEPAGANHQEPASRVEVVRLRRQQAHAVGVRERSDGRPRRLPVRRWRRLPLVQWRLLRPGRHDAPGTPASAAVAQRGHVRAAHVAAGPRGDVLGLAVWRGLRPRHHWRFEWRCHRLDRLELAVGQGWRAKSRGQRVRRCHRRRCERAEDSLAPAVPLYRPLLEVLRFGFQAPHDDNQGRQGRLQARVQAGPLRHLHRRRRPGVHVRAPPGRQGRGGGPELRRRGYRVQAPFG
mmetsp:Transcript_25227/g.75795  ORF Transcript_25227/g.75795 Transcript_25227/m.75795 type:complete len:281 (-) Transcript_25227:122-964(-)